MGFLEYMSAYFSGEKAIGFYTIPFGVMFLVVAVLIRRFHWDNDVAKGLFFPLVLLAAASILVGAVMIRKSDADIGRLSASYEAQPAETISGELARMEKVNGRWLYLKLFWAFLIVAGKGSAFFVRNDTWTGIGLGLMLIGAGGFLVDELAQRRAQIYAAQLQRTALGRPVAE